LNDNLRDTLLAVRSKIFDLEDLRILNYGAQSASYNSDTSYDLE